MDIVQLCEIGMLVAFGFSWPFNIAKSWRSRTARGKSVMFELIVIFGYCVGLLGKIGAPASGPIRSGFISRTSRWSPSTSRSISATARSTASVTPRASERIKKEAFET